MVVKMMRWRRSSSPVLGKKLEVKLVVRRLKGLSSIHSSPLGGTENALQKLMVQLNWKGPKKAIGLVSFGKKTKKCFTRELDVGEDGVVEWNEEFKNVCNFSVYDESHFHPWEVSFSVFRTGSKNKVVTLIGTATLDLGGLVSSGEEEVEINVHIAVPGKSLDCGPSLSLFLSLSELKSPDEPIEQSLPLPLPHSTDAFKASLKKLTDYMSNQTQKKVLCPEEKGDVDDCIDSLDDFDCLSSLGYQTLADANRARWSSLCSNTVDDDEDNAYYYYSKNQKTHEGCVIVEPQSPPMGFNQTSSNRGGIILSWKKRKLSFRSSTKARGEPLLKKYYGDAGGDDIDYDRRQLSSSESESDSSGDVDNSVEDNPFSEFGDDRFVVGKWETREVTSRDGKMKLQTHVFFASIDQRNERAAGESACTALVAVLADWLQSNVDEMPIRSQFDGLIRDGSYEWRKLCENESYKEQFPDKHFDLETILQAGIRPLCVHLEKSFVGFFHGEGDFEFLEGAMSFDSIWDEISTSSGAMSSSVYIVSWNDHFFVLKVEKDAYYIIDTLGERLYEGCERAHILKFDKDTTIQTKSESEGAEVSKEGDGEEEICLCSGKESCKEYIKGFLAAIPVRELQVDMKKGLAPSSIHHRLQIEFHYTRPTVSNN